MGVDKKKQEEGIMELWSVRRSTDEWKVQRCVTERGRFRKRRQTPTKAQIKLRISKR